MHGNGQSHGAPPQTKRMTTQTAIKAIAQEVRRVGILHKRLEKAARQLVMADSWCAGPAAHAITVKRCPCGYAQVRAALAAIDQAKQSNVD